MTKWPQLVASNDPSKLALLGIRNPTIIHVGQSSKQDAEAGVGADGNADGATADEDIDQVLSLKLAEYTCVTDTSQKPFVLAQLLLDALFGAASAEAVVRLPELWHRLRGAAPPLELCVLYLFRRSTPVDVCFTF